MAVTTSEIRLEPMVVTWGAVDLGGTDGGIEVSMEVSEVEVKADAFGETLLDTIQNGNNITLSMTLKELSAAQWARIVGEGYGATNESATTDVTGFGESKLFNNMKQFAKELILKPVGSSDELRNLHFWNAFPLAESVSYSGTDLSSMSVSFKVYRDETKPSDVNMFVFGDGSQVLS